LRLVACSQRAAGLGLKAGLTLAEARARVPLLDVSAADEAGDQALLLQMAESCEIFTPLVALDAPLGLMLDVTGCSHLFGGEKEMQRLVLAHLKRFGISARSSVAGTPDCASALARFSTISHVEPGDEFRAASGLPVMALNSPPDTTLALNRAGLKTLGDLASRPSHVLSARFGEALARKLARVLGRENIRITPLRPEAELVAMRHFAEPVAASGQLHMSLQQLFDEIASGLEMRGLGGLQFEVSFFRVDGKARRLQLQTAEPMRDGAQLFRLIELRLDTLADPLDPGFGFDALRLSVLRSQSLQQKQSNLDGKQEDELAISQLIDRLMVRFGPERVVRFVARDSHDPLRAAFMVPVSSTVASPAWEATEAARPLQLFNPPQPVETMAEVPDGAPLRFRWRRISHEVVAAEGPERIAPEWWRGTAIQIPRDYYYVEDRQGRRFWIYREGLFGQGDITPRWFVHGLFA
jgi:protein ImuB